MPDKHDDNLYFGEDLSLSIGALAGRTAILVASGVTMGAAGLIKTMRIWTQTQALTTLEGSQILIGLTPIGMSAGEVAQALDAFPVHNKDVPETEFSRRYARLIMGVQSKNVDPALTVFFNQSDWFKAMIRFVEDASAYNLFAWNMSTSTITTGGVIKFAVEGLMRFDP